MRETGNGLARDLFDAESEQRTERGIAVATGAVSIEEGDPDRGLLDNVSAERIQRLRGALFQERIDVVERLGMPRSSQAVHTDMQPRQSVLESRADCNMVPARIPLTKSQSGTEPACAQSVRKPPVKRSSQIMSKSRPDEARQTLSAPVFPYAAVAPVRPCPALACGCNRLLAVGFPGSYTLHCKARP